VEDLRELELHPSKSILLPLVTSNPFTRKYVTVTHVWIVLSCFETSAKGVGLIKRFCE